jgi:hypothetical protein
MTRDKKSEQGDKREERGSGNGTGQSRADADQSSGTCDDHVMNATIIAVLAATIL